MSHLFPTNRSLLYPQFETYRLRSLDPDTDLSSYPLPGAGATQSRVGNHQHHLSFKEVRARISWDHLAVGEGGRGVYVDAEWNVVGFQLDLELQPSFCTLASLPVPISASSSSSDTIPEFPSVRQLDPTHWAISTGSGSLYILLTSAVGADDFSGELIARYDLQPTDSSSPVPFAIQAVHTISQAECRILLSRSVPTGKGKGKSKGTASRTGSESPAFELLEVSLDHSARTDTDHAATSAMRVLWQLQANDLPYHCSWTKQGWLALSSEPFTDASLEDSAVKADPIPQKANGGRPIPTNSFSKRGLGARRSGGPQNTVDAVADASESEVAAGPDAERYPYTWTQDSDSISVTIPFPATTRRPDIHIDLQDSGLVLQLRNPSENLTTPLRDFLTLPARQWWSSIDLSLSTYSYNAPRAQLELELTKSDRSVRWPSVFAPSDDEEDDDDVPETLSASTLAAARESFNQIKTREPGEPEGNHPAVPALLREEMDFDLEDGEDYDAGDAVFGDGGGEGGGKTGREVYVGLIKDGQAGWSQGTASVLGVPLQPEEPSILVKSAVDGVLFKPSDAAATQPWTHVSTNPALAFVLSSKRDLRMTKYFVSPTTHSRPDEPNENKKPRLESQPRQVTVLAFDSGSSINTSGNMYSYYPANSKTEAKQGVVRVSGDEKGPLLGVQLLQVGDEHVPVALCEKALVVLHGIL